MRQPGVHRCSYSVNLELAKSIVDVIACPCVEHAFALERFRERTWRSSYHWLITSGLALHLLAALKKCGSETCLPTAIIARLLALDQASAVRTGELRRDFLELNRRFASLGIPYANWKGFALEPDFCEDVRIRPQMDFDFIIRSSDAERFGSVLRDVGYERTRSTFVEATYEIMPGVPYALEQVYHPKPQRKVELHLAADHASPVTPALDLREALDRRRTVMMAGETIPVLANEDALPTHAAHAGRHALEGWVRLGWLHEIDHFIHGRATHLTDWDDVRRLASSHDAPATTAALGIMLAAQVWHRKLPDALGWTAETLPRSAVQWIRQHGERLVMADFPGTKINLLLQRELIGASGWSRVEGATLFRPRAIPRVAHVPPNASRHDRLRAAHVQIAFTSRRIVFHCMETLRYFYFKWLWNRSSSSRKPAACNVPVTVHSNSPDG